MIGPINQALSIIFTPEALGLILLGALIGTLIGAIPGLGGSITLALLIPFSFVLDPENGVLLLMAALGGVNFGGSIPAIILNIPGTAPSIITTIDGYEMTKNNRAGEALGASAVASAAGAIIGVVFIIVSIPVIREILLYFGPPEFMLVSIAGLLIVATVLQGPILNGIIGVCLGVSIGFHGFNSITGGLRFDFGLLYLYDGLPLLVAIIGLFAISEMIALRTNDNGDETALNELGGSPIEGAREVLRHPKLLVTSAVTGIVIGVIPAVGATVSTLIAYSRAKASAVDPSSFGMGDIRGVIAPEGSNDAKDGASLLPTLAFSIPGSPSHAVLLGGLLVHGITPGPALFESGNVYIVYVMIFGLLLANIITSSIGLLSAKKIVRVTEIPSSMLVPVIIVISLFGAYAYRGNPTDMIAVLIMGISGYLAIQADISRIAILFGMILGPTIENTYHQTMQIAASDYSRIYTRPAFIIILTLLILVVLHQVYAKVDHVRISGES